MWRQVDLAISFRTNSSSSYHNFALTWSSEYYHLQRPTCLLQKYECELWLQVKSFLRCKAVKLMVGLALHDSKTDFVYNVFFSGKGPLIAIFFFFPFRLDMWSKIQLNCFHISRWIANNLCCRRSAYETDCSQFCAQHLLLSRVTIHQGLRSLEQTKRLTHYQGKFSCASIELHPVLLEQCVNLIENDFTFPFSFYLVYNASMLAIVSA